MSMQQPLGTCARCDSELFGNFCSACGNPKELKRIDGRYLLSEISSVLNFHKGILFTIKELLIRPGINIQNFILNDRNRLVKPIIFTIVCSLIYTLSQQVFQFEDGYVGAAMPEESATTLIFGWISKNYGYANILMAIFIAFWLKLFFRKYDYNYFEILILLLFLMGIGMLIFAILGMVDSLTGVAILDIGFLFGVLYISWGIGQFFDKKKIGNYLKAFGGYMLGMFSFFFLALMAGSLIDWISQ